MGTLTYSRGLVAGTPENVNDVQAMFDEARTAINSIDSANVTNASLTDTDLASPNNATYKTIQTAAALVHDTHATGHHIIFHDALLANATNTATSGVAQLPILYLDDADYTVASKSIKLRLRAQCLVNDFGLGWTVTAGLYPVSAVGSGGIGDQIQFTIGTTPTAGSTVAFANPASQSRNQNNSGDFAFPADGYYALGIQLSGAATANSRAVVTCQLQVRHT